LLSTKITRNSKGERAAESLYYLGVSLTRLKKLPDACKVYDEFADVYGTTAAAELQTRVTKGRADAKCS
jgi:TolA-binding protein